MFVRREQKASNAIVVVFAALVSFSLVMMSKGFNSGATRWLSRVALH